jgi:hypothetical protein
MATVDFPTDNYLELGPDASGIKAKVSYAADRGPGTGYKWQVWPLVTP